MVTLCKKPLDSFEEPELKKPSDAQEPPSMSKGDSLETEIKSPGKSQELYPTLKKLVDVSTAPRLPPCLATLHLQHHPTGL
jgi:hypothetical protein